MKKRMHQRWIAVPVFCSGLVASPIVSAHSLAQAVQLALSNNPEVLSAQQGIGVAQEQLDQAKAGWMPTVDLAVDMGRELKRKESVAPTAMTKSIASVTLNQPLFDGGETLASVDRSDWMQQVAMVQFDEVRTNVALKAIEAWHELFRLQRVIKLSEVNLGEHKKLFMQTKQKVDAGGADRMELVAVETPWLRAQGELVKARGEYQDALAEYVAVVGVEPIDALRHGLNIEAEQLPQLLSDAKERMLQSNFLLRTAEMNVEAARADHRGSRSGMLPSLDFELKGGRKENDGGVEGVDLDTTALVKLKYNLFNGGADQSRRRETARLVMDSQEQLWLAHRNMVEQLTQYWNGIEVSEQLLGTSMRQLRISQESLESSKEQFKLGEGDVKAIMAASDAVLAAKKAVLGDEIDVHVGRYRLLAHMGELLGKLEVADLMVVMEELEASRTEMDQEGGMDRMLSEKTLVESEPLSSEVSAEQMLVDVEGGSGNVHHSAVVEQEKRNENWNSAYAQMRDAGWVVFNAMDEVEAAEQATSSVRAPAPQQPVVAASMNNGSSMQMVGGEAAVDSAAFQRNRAERRKLELKRRLGNYTMQSSRYQKRLEQQKQRLQRQQTLTKSRYSQGMLTRARLSQHY